MVERDPPPGLEATGERYTPQTHGDIEVEHLHRYAVARELASGKNVLDVACGEGYGSNLLAAVAAHVTGVDIADEVVAHARRAYGRENLEFRVGSCSRIPLPDASVDLVVSFETIEHHHEHEEMLSEVRRVLVPGGLLIISSPDRREYSEIPCYQNPFHVKELGREEFEDLLRRHFGRVELYGQRVRAGSVMGPVGQGSVAAFETYTGTAERVERTPGLRAPLYLVAIAGDGPLPRLGAGLFELGGPAALATDVQSRGVYGESRQPVQVFTPVRGAYSEAHSVVQAVKADGSRQDCVFTLQWDSSAPLRVDPGFSAGLAEIYGMSIRRAGSAVDGLPALSGADLAGARIRTSNAVPLASGTGPRRFVLTSDDPQIHIEIPDWAGWRGQCRLELAIALTPIEDPEVLSALVRLAQDTEADAETGRTTAGLLEAARTRADEQARAIELLETRVRSLSEAHEQQLAAARDQAARLTRETVALRAAEAAVREREELLTRRDEEMMRLESSLRTVCLDRSVKVSGVLLSPLSWASAVTRQLRASGFRHPVAAVRAATVLARHHTHAELLRGSGLFDVEFYRSQKTTRVCDAGDETQDYLAFGAQEGLNPHPLFDTSFYVRSNPDVLAAGVNPLAHYLLYGSREGRSPHPLFEPRFYMTVCGMGVPPSVTHFLRWGAHRGLDPSPWFDTVFYLEVYPDVAASGMNPLTHFLRYGAAEGRNPNGWFDTLLYVRENREVSTAGVNPLVHFVLHGLAEGRRPNHWFDPDAYLQANPDQVGARSEALRHFVLIGSREGRPARPAPAGGMVGASGGQDDRT